MYMYVVCTRRCYVSRRMYYGNDAAVNVTFSPDILGTDTYLDNDDRLE